MWSHHAQWVVTMRNHAEYRLRPGHGWVRDPHPSAYSRVKCLECGLSWNTKADYVSQVPDAHKVAASSKVEQTVQTVSWARCQGCDWYQDKATPEICETHTRETGHMVKQFQDVTTWYYAEREDS